MCRVKWCNNDDRFWKNGKAKSLCSIHIQYEQICSAAVGKDREHLMYKVEKFVEGKHQCENCGFDPVKSYPTLHTKGQSSMLDVDHVISNIKHTIEGEQPSNYQLNCKHCHIVKSHLEGDYIAKKYRK
jgi:hypothetical protein|tara:strand:- start:604 stop:987 length:384 start_codon:yes stop_codon:yes gene_type:complete